MQATKRVLLLALIAAAIVLLFAATREWITLSLVEGAATVSQLSVTGQMAATGVMPIALALLAVGVTLTIAGRVMRMLLAVLVVLLGVWVILTSFSTASGGTAELIVVAGAQISQVTGLGASEHLSAVAEVMRTPWPIVSTAVGVVIALIGLGIVVWGRRWKGAGRKYESTSRRSGTTAGSGADRISDWDTLSDGNDPSVDAATDQVDEKSPDSSSSET